MKDLLVFAADADIGVFMDAILNRPAAVGIRPLTFDIIRHPQRDAGMVQTGPELARLRKREYSKVILLWDHHGSGREKRFAAPVVAAEVSGRLDTVTWSGNHAVVALDPELEHWLWYCEPALSSYRGISRADLDAFVDDHAAHLGHSPQGLKTEQPKELFEAIVRIRLRRTISPRDFAEIGKRAGVTGLTSSTSFRHFVQTLREWFPAMR